MSQLVSTVYVSCRQKLVRSWVIVVLLVSFFSVVSPRFGLAQTKQKSSSTKKSADLEFSKIRKQLSKKLDWPFSITTQDAVSLGNWKLAWTEISDADPHKLEPSFAFLKGYVAFKMAAYLSAYEAFGTASKDPLFQDISSFWAAKAALQQKQYLSAANWASKQPIQSLYRADSELLLVEALLGERRFSDAIVVLDNFQKRFSNGSYGRQAQLLLAKTLIASVLDTLDEKSSALKTKKGGSSKELSDKSLEKRKEQVKRAESLLSDLIHSNPVSSFAAQALNEVKSFNRIAPKTFPRMAPMRFLKVKPKTVEQQQQIVRYYELLMKGHRNSQVVKELPPLINSHVTDPTTKCSAFFVVGKAYTRLRKHELSLEWYQKILAECSGNKDKQLIRNSLYLGGKAAWNAGSYERALSLFDDLLTAFPKHSFADDALYFSARILASQGKFQDARKKLDHMVEHYPDGDMLADAHWMIVRDAFEGKRYMNIVRYIDSLKKSGELSPYTRGRLAYFKGVALWRAKKKKDAKTAFLQVAKRYPMTYYALLALNRLAHIEGVPTPSHAAGSNLCGSPPASRQSWFGRNVCRGLPPLKGERLSVSSSILKNPLFQLGLQLVKLNLESQAQLPFNSLRDNLAKDSSGLWALAFILELANSHVDSYQIVLRSLGTKWINGVPSANEPGGLDRWSLAHPRPYAASVHKWAKAWNVSTALVWSIMRVESAFNPQVESWANAIGLMQLLLPTAQDVAKKISAPIPKREQLFQPDTAIQLGAWYLGDLRKNSSHPLITIAGYNGGWRNVSRWLDENPEVDIDLWVEDIPYGQTRNYTKKVAVGYWGYWMKGAFYLPYIPFKVAKN